MKDNTFLRKLAATADKHTKERDYWLDKMSGEWVKTTFPADYSKTGPNEPHVDEPGKLDTMTFRLPDQLFSQLNRLSNDSHHLLHIVLTAELILLLYKYNFNRNTDIITGSPILRQNSDVTFINTVLVLRNRLEDHMTFKKLLIQTKQTIVEAAENVNYPIESLLLKLNIPYAGNEFPLFDIVLLLENIHDKKDILFTNPNMIFSF